MNPGKGVHWPALLYGLILFGIGASASLVVAVVDLASFVTGTSFCGATCVAARAVAGLFVLLGTLLALLDLFVLLPKKRRPNSVMHAPPTERRVTVVLTAFNDEASIGLSVDDFLSHPLVRRVIVVDNNSHDKTAEVAAGRGAVVVTETKRGYGQCAFRALSEGLKYEDTGLTLLCEGDMTFRAFDLDKFLAYIAHAEIVNGTRIVEQLRARETQLTTFMYYGNFFVGKLLEAKHIGKGTFTDVGTTYKLCRNEVLKALLPKLNPAVNLEFNAHFLDIALSEGLRLVECPVTFHDRVGTSKGGNTHDLRALMVGLRMIHGILVGWRPVKQ